MSETVMNPKKKEKFEKMYGAPVIWYGKKRSIFGLPLTFTTYILTEDRLITKAGFFKVSEDEVELYKITDKKIDFPLFERMVGCGTITLMSTDVDSPIKTLKCIKQPREAKRIMDECITKQRDKYMIRGRDMVGATTQDIDGSDFNGSMF